MSYEAMTVAVWVGVIAYIVFDQRKRMRRQARLEAMRSQNDWAKWQQEHGGINAFARSMKGNHDA